MSSVDDKQCYSPNPNPYIKAHSGRNALSSRRKPAPSKWDDAQKWLVGLSGGGDHCRHSDAKPRDSNADDRRLLASASQKGRDSCSSLDGGLALFSPARYQGAETKKIDRSSESVPVCLRDMGTEMTPAASKEPSRSGTPFRARSPADSRSSSPSRENVAVAESRSCTKSSSLESQASAWDEAERTKYMARFKREEVKIQAWENHETRKAEMAMKKMEAKAERMKSRAKEKLASRIVSARRVAEEKRSTAEAKLNERAARTSERADYIRRTGRAPSSFSFKLPWLCN